MAYSNGYKHRKLITIDHTKVGSFTGYYRVLLNHTDAALKTVANGGYVHKNPLLDIRFEDTSGVKLAHEIVNYVATTGQIEAYVKLDSVSSVSDTTFWMYFGKDLTASSYQGIRIGYESATKMVLERNTISGSENQGEITPYITGMTDPDGNAVTQPSTEPIVGREDGAGEGLTTGWLMYSVADAPSRFGLSDPTWNDHLILVRYSGGQWYYDNNSNISNAFTPVSTDFLVAEVSWNHPTTGRAQNYIGRRPAGEEIPWMTWADEVLITEDIGVVSNNFRNVTHMNKTPETTYSNPSVDRFAMNWQSNAGMGAGDLVDGKVGKGLNFDGSSDYLRAKKDVIWEANTVGYLSFWIKPDSVVNPMCLFSQRTGVGTGASNNVFLLAGGALRADFGSTGNWSTGWSATAGVWQKVVIETDGANPKLFVNGVQVATTTTDHLWSSSSSYHHVQLGASISDASNSGNYYDGLMDEFRSYATDRGAGFHLTEYNNENSPGTFYSSGTLNTHMDANESSHGHSVDGGLGLTQHLTAIIQDALHGHAVDSVNVIEHKLLAVQDTLHALFFASIDVPLIPDDSAIQVASDVVELLQKHNLTVSDATHSVSFDGTTLTVNVFLEGDLDTLHVVTSTTPNLIQQFFIIAQKATHKLKFEMIPAIVNWTALKFFKGKYKNKDVKQGELTPAEIAAGTKYKNSYQSSGEMQEGESETGSYKAGETKNGNYF